jgi:protein O-GlcNAc transferase
VNVTRGQYGISEDKFVFCNFNQLYKIDPETFTVWMRILKRVPNSVLWLLRFPAAGEGNLRKEARELRIRDDQLIFSDVVPREEHIKRGYLADLFLDTPVYNAQTTACDIL